MACFGSALRMRIYTDGNVEISWKENAAAPVQCDRMNAEENHYRNNLLCGGGYFWVI